MLPGQPVVEEQFLEGGKAETFCRAGSNKRKNISRPVSGKRLSRTAAGGNIVEAQFPQEAAFHILKPGNAYGHLLVGDALFLVQAQKFQNGGADLRAGRIVQKEAWQRSVQARVNKADGQFVFQERLVLREILDGFGKKM
jgi:hypothetical protein